jgi:hypothetical protein
MTLIARQIVVKAFFTLSISFALWFSICFFLPFGNHLTYLLADADSRLKKRNLFENIFLHEFISNKRIEIIGIDCDSNLVESTGAFPIGYKKTKNTSISLGIQVFNQFKENYSEQEERMARRLVVALINSCDPNTSGNNTPPLLDAILTRDRVFVQQLLNRGANPKKKFISPISGNAVDAVIVANAIAEKMEPKSQEAEEFSNIINLLK